MLLSDDLGAYRGRFAPSPSGPLHFGSLVAALASYLDAKANKGHWLVRIEDIDTPRVVPGSSDSILRTLEAYGLHWDESVVYQSQRHALYQQTIDSLHHQQLIYGCTCTRKKIKQEGGFYLNSCRNRRNALENNAIRLKQNHPVNHYVDLIKGYIEVDANFSNEDFIIKRRDQLFAYQLVVVLDDIEQAISHVVRGADLLDPTVRQISLFKLLNPTVPKFAHLPLAVTKPGYKLSKQNFAPAIDIKNPSFTLCHALRFLGIAKESDMALLSQLNRDDLLNWAIAQWHLAKVRRENEIQIITSESGFNFQPLSSINDPQNENC